MSTDLIELQDLCLIPLRQEDSTHLSQPKQRVTDTESYCY